MHNLPTILTQLMTKKGIKSAELARQTQVGQPVIHRLMTGNTENPQILTLKPLADFFAVSIDQLLGYAPLTENRAITSQQLKEQILHEITNAKVIATALADLLPKLIDGYQKAAKAKLIQEVITTDIFPLLILNINNLLKTTHQLQELLTANSHLF